jgi:hypothetical protein
VFFATDVANFLACRHLLTLDRAEARGEIAKPVYYDSGAELLRELGIRHEQAFLRHLIDTERLEVVEIPTVDISWTDAVARTVDAVRQGADAIYQATFQDGPWGGRSDFLVRVDKPTSTLGRFSYEVVETKLARSAKVRAIPWRGLSPYPDLQSRRARLRRIIGAEPLPRKPKPKQSLANRCGTTSQFLLLLQLFREILAAHSYSSSPVQVIGCS